MVDYRGLSPNRIGYRYIYITLGKMGGNDMLKTGSSCLYLKICVLLLKKTYYVVSYLGLHCLSMPYNKSICDSMSKIIWVR